MNLRITVQVFNALLNMFVHQWLTECPKCKNSTSRPIIIYYFSIHIHIHGTNICEIGIRAPNAFRVATIGGVYQYCTRPLFQCFCQRPDRAIKKRRIVDFTSKVIHGMKIGHPLNPFFHYIAIRVFIFLLIRDNRRK